MKWSKSYRDKYKVHLTAIPAWVCLAALDFILMDSSPSPEVVISGLCLAATAGFLVTMLFQIGYELLRFLPNAARWIAWLIWGIGAGLFLAEGLGAFTRLSGQYRNTAVGIIAISVCAGAVFGASAALFQPGKDRKDAIFTRIPLIARISVAVFLFACAGATVYADRTFYPGLYPEGHLALQLGAIAAAAFAWQSLKKTIPLRKLPVPVAVVAALIVGLTAIPFFKIDNRFSTALTHIGKGSFTALALRVVRDVTDVDRDGYSGLLGGGDCGAFNASIHPGAFDIPGNGVNENCEGGDRRTLVAPSIDEVPIPLKPSPMNVVLITIDSTRADHLKPYGYALDTMPHLTRWAEDASVFEKAYAVAPWTGISVPSMMRGIYPRRMSWRRYVETTELRLLPAPVRKSDLHDGESGRKSFLLPSAEGYKSAAYWLKRRGMTTAAIINDGYSRMLTDIEGAADGFDTYEIVEDAVCKKQSGDVRAAELALARIAQLKTAEPYFLWVHLFGAHVGRFEIPQKFQKFSPKQKNNYDDKLYFVDAQVKKILDAVENGPSRLPVSVMVSADHGEAISGKKMWHGNGLTEDVLRVPLIVKIPNEEPQRIDTPVGIIDLAPTILSLTQTAAPDLDGADLTKILRKEPIARRYGLISDNWHVNNRGKVTMDLSAAYDGGYKMQRDCLTNIESLVSQEDADRDLSRKMSEKRAEQLRKKLSTYLEDSGNALSLE